MFYTKVETFKSREMNKMDIIKKINAFVGVDWSLDKINIDDELKIYLLDDRGYQVTITCYSFIGFSLVGNWDESIIEYIKVEPEGDLITISLQRIRQLHVNSPLSAEENMKIDSTWYQLNIKLIDGNVIKVACEDFDFDFIQHKAQDS